MIDYIDYLLIEADEIIFNAKYVIRESERILK